jgi:mRNA-degrading endonuclease RelE of RelBE toxin-antitoxin system
MTWRIDWSHPALAALRSIPWRDAARVDAAVQRLALLNEGEILRVKEHPTAARLRVGPYIAYINLDRFSGTLSVWHVYRH